MSGAGLQGYLELRCGLDSRGLSSLRHQAFSAPFHVSKPYLDEGVLVVNIVNPTAGFLAGDRARCEVQVESGAALLLTTPAANRAYRMPGGRAEVEQRFEVAAGGWLEVWPELFIPQNGTRFRQSTVLEVESGAEALFFETLAPGRVASGEAFAFASLEWETDVRRGGTLVARERYELVPGGAAVRVLQGRFPAAYYASCFILTERLPAEHACWAAIHGWQSEELWIGCSPLAVGGWTVKLVAAGSVGLRRTLTALRGEICAALGRRVPMVRRAGG